MKKTFLYISLILTLLLDAIMLLIVVGCFLDIEKSGATPVVFAIAFLIGFAFLTIKIKNAIEKLKVNNLKNVGSKKSLERKTENKELTINIDLEEVVAKAKKSSVQKSSGFFENGFPIPEGCDDFSVEQSYPCFADFYWITYKCVNGDSFRTKIENMTISRNYLFVYLGKQGVSIPFKSIILLEDGATKVTDNIAQYIRNQNKRLRR